MKQWKTNTVSIEVVKFWGFELVRSKYGTLLYPLSLEILVSLTSYSQIFGEFRDTGNKYKQRIRSRISNLGDVKNPSLRQNVIWGQINPAKIAIMTTEV